MNRLLVDVIALIAVALAGCVPASSPPALLGTVEAHLVAGPVCPVETLPPDPGCAPRPVVGAVVVVSPSDGREIAVATGTSDVNGIVRLQVAAGSYIVTAGSVAGLMGMPPPTPVTVQSGTVSLVTLEYDTGIR
jgi:hypothetical protein